LEGVDFLLLGTVSGDDMSTEVIVKFISVSRERTETVEKTFRATGVTTQRVMPIIRKLIAQIQMGFPLTGYLVKVQRDRIYLDLGGVDGVKTGDIFDVFQKSEGVTNLQGEVIAPESVKLRQVQVVEVQDKYSVAKRLIAQDEGDFVDIAETGTPQLERGMFVQKVEAQVEFEQPMPSEQVIAILPFVNHSQEKVDWLGRTISDTLSTELSQLTKFRLAERQRLEQILGEHKLTASELFDPNTIVETGHLWKERYIIAGGYQKLGDKYRIDARRLDVQTSEVFEAQGLIATEDNVFESVQDLGERLRKSIDKSVRRRGVNSLIEGILVDEKHLEQTPTSVYHLFSTLNAYLVEYTLENTTESDQRLIITTQLLGYSHPQKETLDIPVGEVRRLQHTPIFLAEKLSSLLQVQEAGLELKISAMVNGRERLIFQKTPKIQLLPRDNLPWRLNTPDNQSIDLLPAIVAWVSPDSPIVAQILGEAAEYSPYSSILGYQRSDFLTGENAEASIEEKRVAIRKQVKAIYQVLQEKYHIRYVDQSTQYPGRKGQRILHPSDVLNYKSANCIDGVVLFASLLYRAGINPIIVIVPGHAFLGWKAWHDIDEYEFLETTKLGVADFETAFSVGKEAAQEAITIEQLQRLSFDWEGQLKVGEAILLDVKTLKEQKKFTEIPIK